MMETVSGVFKKYSACIPALFFAALVFGMPSAASAADRYWVGDGGTWSDTAHWSDVSGGGSGFSVPSTTDNCFFDVNSFLFANETVTITATAECADMTWTTTNAPHLNLNNAGNALNLYGSLTFAAGMTVDGNTDLIQFPADTGTYTVTSNGVSIDLDMVFASSTDAVWVLQDSLNARSVNLIKGTLDANDFNVTAVSFESSNTNVRTLNMGSGTWTLTGTSGTVWNINDPFNLTLNAETSTVSIGNTGAAQKTFEGGGLTYYNAIFGGNNVLINGTNTFDSIHVENAGQPKGLIFQSTATQVILTNFVTNASVGNMASISASIPGTLFILSKASGTISVDYMNIQDSDAIGGAHWYAGANSVDKGGNTGWIFTAVPTDRYWVGNSGTWNGTDTTHWAYSSGGASGAPVPSATNDCFFDDNSFSGLGQTVTISTTHGACLDVTWTTTYEPTLAIDNGFHLHIDGSLVFAAGMTVGPGANDYIMFLAPTGTFGITSNGVSINTHIYFYGTSGVWVLQDNLSTSSVIHLENGTLDANDFNVDADSFSSNVTNTRSLTMGSGTWTLGGTTGGVWDLTDPTNLTFDAETSTIEISNTAGTQKEFYGGSLTYNIVTISGRAIEITGSNTFNTLNVDNGGFADALFINNSTTQTVTNFTTNGSSGNLAIMGVSTPLTPPFTLSKASGTVSVDYMNIYGSTATGGALWYAGANSIDGGGNSGWIFTPPSAASTPIAAPVAGTYTGTQSVTLSSAGSATIRYTTDGSTPTCLVGTLYGGAISVSTSLTIKAVGCDGSSIASPVGTFAYVINAPPSGGGGGGGYYVAQQPTATPIPTFTPVPFPQLPTRGDPANLARYGLREGDVMGARPAGDPDVFIVNQWGYKRLFLNPVIFGFYGHLGGFAAVTSVVPFGRDAFPTSGLFRNCETLDRKVYALEVTGEDTGTLHWVNIPGDQAVAQDPDFFKKDFCINSAEFAWYTISPIPYTSLSQLPVYRR